MKTALLFLLIFIVPLVAEGQIKSGPLARLSLKAALSEQLINLQGATQASFRGNSYGLSAHLLWSKPNYNYGFGISGAYGKKANAANGTSEVSEELESRHFDLSAMLQVKFINLSVGAVAGESILMSRTALNRTDSTFLDYGWFGELQLDWKILSILSLSPTLSFQKLTMDEKSSGSRHLNSAIVSASIGLTVQF